jgi:2'-5' RNA ligase
MNKSRTTLVFNEKARDHLQERYDRLWSASIGDIRAGNIKQDSVLAAGLADRRRGLTVIARPSPSVRQRVAAFLGELRSREPDQYYYAPSDFHVTVLSLFTATVEHERFLAQSEQYVAAVDLALRNMPPIQIEFAGITASPAAVMVQGFCENEALNEAREALRWQLRSRGLAEGVDRRYRLETAHMTVARFPAPLQNSKQFATTLERARRLPFGVANITRVSLVKNDWYMSRQTIETIERYQLPNGVR